jgi:hypothetical protein
MMVYPTPFHPAAPVAAQAAVITVRSGDERGGVDIQLQPARTVRISGRSPRRTEWPRTSASGCCRWASDALVDEIETATAMSDATGAFSFLGVPPGQYVLRVVRVPRPPPDAADPSRLTVQAGGIRVSTAPPPPGPRGAGTDSSDATLCAQVPLVVGGDDLANVVVPLAPGPRLSGRVEFDGRNPCLPRQRSPAPRLARSRRRIARRKGTFVRNRAIPTRAAASSPTACRPAATS